ncbi:MAG: glycosyltransferase family 39 protein [Methyloceanibacter sp.]
MPPPANASFGVQAVSHDRAASNSVSPRTASARFWGAAILLAASAAVIFHLAPSLPLDVAFDEPLKVGFVRDGGQNFQHPILMLQAVRLAAFLVGATDEASVFALGRLAASVSGGLLVFSAIALARRATGDLAALGAGLLTAVAPLTVLHAQLFKEDIFVAPWLILGVLALDRLVETPIWRRAVWFGLAAGLAASAKYAGLVLLGLSLLPPLWAGTDLRRYYRMVALAAAVAGAVFCAIDLPLFVSPLTFIGGVRSEVDHALRGHLIVLYGWQSHFLFTWTANLWPGLRAPLALAGLAGALIVAATWRRSPSVLRRLLIFGLVWYLLHELPPMKPFPEGARHMTVMAAVFAIFAAFAAEWIASRFQPRFRAFAAAAVIAAIAVLPALVSYRLVSSAPGDTQLVVRRIVATLPGETLWARPVTFEPSLELSRPIETIEQLPGFTVINELFAAQYIEALSLSGQKRPMRQRARAYEALLRRPALRVSSKAGRFAFRNAPYRIVALQGDPQALKAAAERFAAIPGIELDLVPGHAITPPRAD